MFAQFNSRIRLSVMALPLAGALFFIGLLLRGQPADDPRSSAFDPAHFAQAVSTTGYGIGWPILISGMVCLLFGYFAVYGYLAVSRPRVERTAFIALLLAVGGAAFQIGVFGIFAFVYSTIGKAYLSGNTDRVDLLFALFAGGLTPYVAISGLLYLAGTILFAIVIWRSQTLPKWAGTFLPLYELLLLAPAFQVPGLVAFVLELLGAVLLVFAGGAIALAVRRQLRKE